jgi:NAD(P)-dependent dehydrogenase (short-subunit alcohol dehydrogenase family)
MNGGLRSLCRSVATGYGRDNIRINTICPGAVETSCSSDRVAAKGIEDRLPLRRLASTRDVANVALFLASPAASYISGTDVFVDGGWLATVS